MVDIEDICCFQRKIEIYFNELTPSVIFSRVAQPLVKILPMVFSRCNKFRSFTEKKPQIFYLFHTSNPFWEKVYQNPVQFFSVIPRGVPLPHSKKLQYYVKREKCKVNDVIFPSGCEACAINLGNKNVKIGIFTGDTSVRSKNIFIAISRHPTGKHEIKPSSTTTINYVSTNFRNNSSKTIVVSRHWYFVHTHGRMDGQTA